MQSYSWVRLAHGLLCDCAEHLTLLPEMRDKEHSSELPGGNDRRETLFAKE